MAVKLRSRVRDGPVVVHPRPERVEQNVLFLTRHVVEGTTENELGDLLRHLRSTDRRDGNNRVVENRDRAGSPASGIDRHARVPQGLGGVREIVERWTDSDG